LQSDGCFKCTVDSVFAIVHQLLIRLLSCCWKMPTFSAPSALLSEVFKVFLCRRPVQLTVRVNEQDYRNKSLLTNHMTFVSSRPQRCVTIYIFHWLIKHFSFAPVEFTKPYSTVTGFIGPLLYLHRTKPRKSKFLLSE